MPLWQQGPLNNGEMTAHCAEKNANLNRSLKGKIMLSITSSNVINTDMLLRCYISR